MNVIILYKEDYPWDIRVEKIAKSLAGMGHRVTIVCQNLKQLKRSETIGNIDIRRLPRTSGKWSFLRSLVNFAFWFNPFWIRELARATPKTGRTVIIVRDLPLVLTGLLVGARRRNAKVVFDMAECYPELYASRREFSKQGLVESFLKSPSLAAVYERMAVKRVDHTFVMIEESFDRLERMGLDTGKVSIVSNTPVVTDNSTAHAIEHEGAGLRIVYVGFMGRIRGLDLLVRAVAEFVERSDGAADIRLDIVGKGDTRAELNELVRTRKLEPYVTLHGWLEQSEVDRLMEGANVGALTYRVCRHWNSTIPNKLFDYMLAGLPVLTTEAIPIRRIVEETDCGLICRDQDAGDVAEKLLELRDPALRQRLGENGRKAVLEKYNWAREERVMQGVLDTYDPGA